MERKKRDIRGVNFVSRMTFFFMFSFNGLYRWLKKNLKDFIII